MMAQGELRLSAYGDDDRAGLFLFVELADQRECGLQSRDADRKSGCRHRLAAKARNQSIIASAAADRAKAHGPTFFVFGVEEEFYFKDWAGVIFEAADDGWVDLNPVRLIT